MTTGKLTPLQNRLLVLLVDADPNWTLGGGAALAAVYTMSRETRDLGGTFTRLRASVSGEESVILDLIAEPTPPIEGAVAVEIAGVSVPVATAHEILVEKLCALLGRSELRDLADVRDLIESGGDLNRAVHDAPRKDGGFSPLTLAWTLRGLDIPRLVSASGWDPDATDELASYRESLVERLLAIADPRT